MLKLLLVYYEPQASGQTTHVLSLARGLDLRRYELTVVLPQGFSGPVAAFQGAGAHVVPLPLRKLVWAPRAVTGLIDLIRETDPDIVHVHSQEAGLVARPLARLGDARTIVYTPQTIDIRRARWQWLYHLLERILAGPTTAIVSVNEADRQRLIDWGIPSHKVTTIPNGIDLDSLPRPDQVDREVRAKAALRGALGLDPDRPLVLQAGRLSTQKDPLTFVEGAARVIESQPAAQFALLGDGPLRQAVTDRIRDLDLEGQVHVLGWQADAARLLGAADVVTLTSRWEGAPYAVLEAMAWARPVVSTAVNGCPEIVVEGETGYLAPPGDASAWAEEVTRLLGDPAHANALGRQGRRRAESHYSLAQMIARLDALYQGLILQKGR
jgi:glycosyltransferase involved in cell wall biosynthesis